MKTAFLSRPFAHVVVIALAMIPALALAAAASYRLSCTATHIDIYEVSIFRTTFGG